MFVGIWRSVTPHLQDSKSASEESGSPPRAGSSLPSTKDRAGPTAGRKDALCGHGYPWISCLDGGVFEKDPHPSCGSNSVCRSGSRSAPTLLQCSPSPLAPWPRNPTRSRLHPGLASSRCPHWYSQHPDLMLLLPPARQLLLLPGLTGCSRFAASLSSG